MLNINIKLTRIFTILFLLLITLSTVGCDKNNTVNNDVALDSLLSIDILDIGQGDSILVRSNRETMLIDAGDTDGKDVIVPYLKKLGIQKLDYVIFTHPHKDHIGSGADVIKMFNIGKVYMCSKISTTRTYEKLLDTINLKGANVIVPEAGDIIKLGSCRVDILGPVKKYSDMNNSSLVLKITCGSTKFIFTGDMEKEAEQDLIYSGVNLKADLLKVGHHGSRGASSNEFLEKVTPSISIISCGKNNDYGHPHKEALSRLAGIGSKIYRTDELGTIKISSNGKNFSIINSKNTINDSNRNQNNQENKSEYNTYIGNKKSKVFHIKNCKNLPMQKNRVYFKTRKEAVEAGYKPCSRCNP